MNSVLLIFVIQGLLLLTVFLIPLLGAYKGLGFEQIKVLFFILSISLISFVWMLNNPQIKLTLISKVAGAFVLILFLTSILGINPLISILGTQPYFQGWILYAYFFLFFLMVSWTKVKLEHWAYILVGTATIVALLAIGQWIQVNLLGYMVPTYAGRVVSTFGQPNFYAGFILLTLPFWYLLIKRSSKFWLWSLIGFILIIGIILSFSRIALILTLLLLVGWFIQGWLKKGWTIIALIASSLVIGFVLVLFSQQIFSQEWKSPSSQQWLIDNAPEKRIFIWPVIVELIKIKPVLGYGLENIAPTFSKYFIDNKHALFEENLKVQPALLSLRDINLDRTHNYSLDLFLFSGIVGVLSWVILAVLLIRKTIHYVLDREYNEGILLVALITYLIWIQFQNQSIVHLLYFWLIAGIIDKD